jgi:hypothetical protein
MQAGREHRVPLSDRGMEILKAMLRLRTSEFIFPGTKAGQPLLVMALAHLLGDQVERVYRRGDALEKRRVLMDAWAAFCALHECGGVVAFARGKK